MSTAGSLRGRAEIAARVAAYRAKKELEFGGEIWEKSFYDRRVRDAEDYHVFRHYIQLNPVKKGLVAATEGYFYSSARPGFLAG